MIEITDTVKLIWGVAVIVLLLLILALEIAEMNSSGGGFLATRDRPNFISPSNSNAIPIAALKAANQRDRNVNKKKVHEGMMTDLYPLTGEDNLTLLL